MPFTGSFNQLAIFSNVCVYSSRVVMKRIDDSRSEPESLCYMNHDDLRRVNANSTENKKPIEENGKRHLVLSVKNNFRIMYSS